MNEWMNEYSHFQNESTLHSNVVPESWPYIPIAKMSPPFMVMLSL